MRIFKLPDLGEGLQEAEIREWHVQTGESVKTDDPLVSVETDKAVVDVPSPFDGKLEKRFAEVGERLHVGAPLAGFEGPGEEDKGTVVGDVRAGVNVEEEEAPPAQAPAVTGGGGGQSRSVKVTPAVRGLAAKLKVDLAMVTPTGPDNLVTAKDVERVAKILAEVGPQELLRGVRRSMALNMSLAHNEVASATIMDDADIHKWDESQNMMVRLIRAVVAACRAEPALNGWYDSKAIGRRLLEQVHLGLAIDSPDGLFVPVLRDVNDRSGEEIRREVDEKIEAVKTRRIKLDELRGNTITLSNFGTIAGRYASPIIVPPTMAIVGAGRRRDAVVAFDGKAAVHPSIPVSVTFDHRAVTGGEAARFLKALLVDLEKSA